MLIVKIWCLTKLQEETLHLLHNNLVAAAINCDFKIRDERDMVNLFPVDAMSYGLGSEIVVEVIQLPPINSSKVSCAKLLMSLTRVIREMFTQSRVHGWMLVDGNVVSDTE